MTIEELQKRVEELEKRVNYPLSIEFVNAIELAKFNSLNSLKYMVGTSNPIADGTYSFYVEGATGKVSTMTIKGGIIISITTQ